MKGNFQIITSLLRLDHQPRLPFYLKKVILSKMSKIREAESGIAAEQEGIAYMGEFTGYFDILHSFQFLGIKESVWNTFVLDSELAEWVGIGRKIAG